MYILHSLIFVTTAGDYDGTKGGVDDRVMLSPHGRWCSDLDEPSDSRQRVESGYIRSRITVRFRGCIVPSVEEVS